MTNELIERLDAATGPDRIFDRDIEIYRGHSIKHPYYGAGQGYLPAQFTGSIDAAMTLVPRGWIVSIVRYFNSDGEWVSHVTLTNSFSVGRGCDPEDEISVEAWKVETGLDKDPTPLAICIAALRAQEKDDG